MGQPKLSLDFHGELMLTRVIRLLQSAVSRIVVVAAPGQQVPPLGAEVELLRDDVTNCGPMAGLVVGLEALAPTDVAAFVTACDAPLLVPEFVEKLAQELGSFDCVVPQEEAFCHPLSAVYRTSISSRIRQQIAAGELSLQRLVDQLHPRRIPVDELRSVDPALLSLRSLNTQDDYLAAMRLAGPG